MTTRLLSDRIKDLHLKPDAPYPSETRDAHDLVLQWRRSQRMRIVKQDREDDQYDVPNDDGVLDERTALT